MHLSRCTTPTSLISTSDSLMWVLHKCCRTEAQGRRIVGIDGTIAGAHTAVFHSARFVKELKKRNMFQARHVRASNDSTKVVNACNCKGLLEYFVYGEIRQSAIISTVAFEDIEALVHQSESVRNFLRMDVFHATNSMRALSVALSTDKMPLRRGTGIAIARLAHLFGLSALQSRSTLADFIAQMLKKWCIRVIDDDEEINVTFRAFARVLGSAVNWTQRQIVFRELKEVFEETCKSLCRK